MCIIKKLEGEGICFSLEYSGSENYETFWDIKTILDNKESFCTIINSANLNEIKSVSQYMDFLCLKKIDYFHEVISTIKNETDKNLILKLADLSAMKCKSIENKELIQFINESFQNIFAPEFHRYALPKITLTYIILFQKGIDIKVFEFLCRAYNFLVLDKYQDFQKIFDKNIYLFEKLFLRRNLAEVRELRFESVFPVFEMVLNGKNEVLKKFVADIINTIIQDFEKIFPKVSFDDSRNVLIVERECSYIYNFLRKIKHPKANLFREYQYQINDLISKNLDLNGASFAYEIPVGEIISYIKSLPKWETKMLMITHQMKEENGEIICISRLGCPSKGKQGLIDMVSSNLPSDDYYTHSHQNWLKISMAVGAATISAMWEDPDLFPECMNWYAASLAFIDDHIDSIEKLSEDIEMLAVMLQPVIFSRNPDQKELSPLCYGVAMFTCALIEKILRVIYIHLLKDKMYIPLTNATLGTLLSARNQEMIKIFGEDHLKNIIYFLNTVGDKKIGWNYRNLLAHWVELKKSNINSMLVAQLLYLYTDIINTVFWYFLSLTAEFRDE